MARVLHAPVAGSNITQQEMRTMKKYGIFFFAAVLCLVGTARAEQIVDRIVAVVDGEIITFQELLQQTQMLTDAESGPALGQAMPQVLDVMIDSLVLKQEAERLEVQVTDAEVDSDIQQFKARRQLTDEAFAQGLRLQGLTLEQFRERTREDIMRQRMLGFMVRRKVIVTQEEIDDYIARNKAELITDRTLDLQVLIVDSAEEAATLRAAIQTGELTFSEAVARYSKGPKVSDGALETVRWRDLAGPWREGLRGVGIGEMSEPFPVQEKWAVLKLLNQVEEDPRAADLVEEEVREAIMRPKMEERFKEYMTDLRAKSLIEKRL